jgi:hypothetical protein
MEPEVPKASTSKKVATLVWVVVVVALVLCLFGAVSGPKIGTLFKMSASALAGDDAGR